MQLSFSNYMPTSDKMYKLLGLNLLFLLSGNRLSEFHTELELLSANVIQTDECIQPILALEQYIMEGRYNKIFQAKVSLEDIRIIEHPISIHQTLPIIMCII